jgi:hypothetical protein
VAKGTILRLLAEVGKACADYQARVLRNIPAKRIQIDEIWSFVGRKEKKVTAEKIERDGYVGDVWTFVALAADTKLVLSWMIGEREAGFATEFLRDVSARVSTRVQLTTDGHKMYLIAVPVGLRQGSISRN